MTLKKLGRYELIRVLGKGAMGVVYEGKDPNLDRRVAIKTVKVENLSEEAAAEYEHRFRTEARSAARLQHPNIVSVYDSDRDGDTAFLVMEYVHGEDLKHHLDGGVRYSLEQSLKMIRDLLAALDYAHRQGIVHRDIKPANLMIEPGGRLKLTDFGVARIQDSGEATRTQGSMVGTLKYMAPEQVQGQKTDSRADLFSAAVVLYQLLTDKRPFDGDNDFSIIHQVIGHDPPPPSSFNARLPAAIDAVVARGLAKDREQRFGTAREFATALQSAIRRADDPTVVPPAAEAGSQGEAMSQSGFTAPGVAPAGSVTTPSAINTVTQELELLYWKDIRDSTDADELQGFLAKFPAGIYADLARKRLRKLETGASGEQTVLSGTPAASADADATRVRTDTSTPVYSDWTKTVTQVPDGGAGSGSAPQVAATAPASPEPASASSGAAAPVGRGPAPSAPEPARKSQAALFGGIAAFVVAGVAVAMFATRGADGTPASGGLAQAPAASAPAAGPASQPTAAPAAPTVGSAPIDATPTAPPSASGARAPWIESSKAAPARPAASAARRPASRSVRSTAGTPAEPARPSIVAPAPVQPEPQRGAEPARAAAYAQVEACREKVFLSRELCMAEHCDKPGARNHPLCVKRRADARLREDSKVRPQ